MDYRKELVGLISKQMDQDEIRIPIRMALDIATELERLARVRKDLDPATKDFEPWEVS